MGAEQPHGDTMTTASTRARAVTLLGALLVAGQAHAFSDPSAFESNPIDDGGGGGRWFTGSPADGYTCAVCHSGAKSPELLISGLPVDGYLPGATYEVIIDWPDGPGRVGANVEITDQNGAGVGTVQLPEGSARDPRELCDPLLLPDFPAASLNTVAARSPQLPSRTVINVTACGARWLRFLWTATTEPRGQLWFSGAVVDPDNMETVSGDGVNDFGRPIAQRGREAVASTVGGCSVTSSRSASSSLWTLMLTTLAALSYSRSRRRWLRSRR